MSAPGGIEADIPGLRELSGDLGLITGEVEAVGRVIGQVPGPSVAGYGWEPTVEAMGRVLSAWSTEIDLLRQVCQQMTDAARQTADNLQDLDDRTSGRFDGMMRPS